VNYGSLEGMRQTRKTSACSTIHPRGILKARDCTFGSTTSHRSYHLDLKGTIQHIAIGDLEIQIAAAVLISIKSYHESNALPYAILFWGDVTHREQGRSENYRSFVGAFQTGNLLN
jgi:hypothetical protein